MREKGGIQTLRIEGNCQTARTDYDLNPYAEKFWVLLDDESGRHAKHPELNLMGSSIIRINSCRANIKCAAVDERKHWSDIEVGSSALRDAQPPRYEWLFFLA